MKLAAVFLAIFSAAMLAHGQRNFVSDQESLTVVEGAAPLDSFYQPVGQSFIPTLPSIGFVQLNLFCNSGATVLVNVRADSITGTILGSSSLVFIPDLFSGVSDFLFSTPVSLTPGVTYYLQPVIQSGGAVSSYVTDGSYPGGTEIIQGSPISFRDLWFREGIVVPEPSSLTLIVLPSVLLFVTRKRASKE